MRKFTKQAKGIRYIKNDDKLFNSSSGGISLGLSEYIINNHGIVYGAAFNNKNELEHIRVENYNDLKKIQGSKYIQSNLKNTFRNIKNDLEKNMLVLFVGTPCQVAGLKSFLLYEYENLYTLDFACRGVPSPKYFRKYLEWHEDKYKEKIKQGDINFRHKKYGWNYRNQMFYVAKIGNHYSYGDTDPYNYYFLRKQSYRQSCYSCIFKDNNYLSDFTVGDLSGAWKLCPIVANNKGTSYIIFNTKHGLLIFDKAKESFIYEDVNVDVLKKYNDSITKRIDKPKERDNFYLDINKKKYIENLKNKIPIKDRIKPFIPYLILKTLRKIKNEK